MPALAESKVEPVVLNLTGDPDAAKGLIVPEGGKLVVVKVRVDPAWDWNAMLKAACPDYQSRDVQNVGHLFPPVPGEPKWCHVVGVNFDKSIPNTQPAVDWGKENKLAEASPRHIFTVARDVPDLNKKVGMSWMGLISPTFCTFGGGRRVCHADFSGAGRVADLFWFDFGWRDLGWFAFFRECAQA